MYFCLGEVTYPSINSTLEKVDLGEDHLILSSVKSASIPIKAALNCRASNCLQT